MDIFKNITTNFLEIIG